MRLFIAIQLSEEARQLVEDIQTTFRWRHVKGKYSTKENLHITLAFIGDYGDPDQVLDVMNTVAFDPFTLELDHIGCFDELWWAGVSESSELETLAKNLRHALADAGIPFDKKKFKAHITFLRKPEYTQGSIAHMSFEPAVIRVTRISLMQSTRGKNGMIYTELGSVEAGRRREV